MKKLLCVAAAVVALAASVLWLATGANRGWTKTSVVRLHVDEVTGIEGRTYEKQFIPGVDFLGVSWLGAAALAGASRFVRKPTIQPKHEAQHP